MSQKNSLIHLNLDAGKEIEATYDSIVDEVLDASFEVLSVNDRIGKLPV